MLDEDLIAQWLGPVYQLLRWLGFSEAWHFGGLFIFLTFGFIVSIKLTSERSAIKLNQSEIDMVREAKSKKGLSGILAAFKAGEQMGSRSKKSK